MLIDVAVLRRRRVRPLRVVHCGAHLAQESALYRSLGVQEVLWIEANPALVDRLAANAGPRDRVVGACLTAHDDEPVTLHIAESVDGTNEGQSSSLLPLGTHADKHPEVAYVAEVETVGSTLDRVVSDNVPVWLRGALPLMVNADVQGAELAVMQGAARTLDVASWVYCEVNVDELYRGCGMLADLDAFLVAAGFELVDVELAGCRRRDCSDGGNRWVGWGDGLWERSAHPRPFADTHPNDAADWFTAPESAGG